MNFISIGEKLGRAIDGKKGAKIGKAIAVVFEETIPLILQTAIEQDETERCGSINEIKVKKDKNDINQIGFTINKKDK